MSIGRTSLLLAPLAIASRAVAFFVPVVVARWYGVQSATDAFYWALTVPTVLLILGTTTMGTVLVPVMARLRVEAPERLPSFVGTAAAFAGTMTGLAGVGIAVAAPWLLPKVTSFDVPTQALTVRFAWALVPFVIAQGLAAVLRATCEVHARFSAPASSPVVRAVFTLLGVHLLRDAGSIALPAGVVWGSVMEVAMLAAVLWREGLVPRPTLSFPPELRAAVAAFGPVLGGETMVALNLFIDKLFAGTGPPGSVTLLEYADRARMIPQSLLESTLMVVAFNAWAAARARGEDEGRHRAVATALWWVLLLAPPVLGGMVVGRVALARLLYGSFTDAQIVACADALGGFLPGVLLSLLGALVAKAHIVAGRYRLVLVLGVLSFGLNAALNATLMRIWGLTGLAVSTSVTTAIVTLTSLQWLLPELRPVFPRAATLKALGLAAASGALALGAVALGFTPSQVTDPRLWAAAVPYFGLLAVGALLARRGP